MLMMEKPARTRSCGIVLNDIVKTDSHHQALALQTVRGSCQVLFNSYEFIFVFLPVTLLAYRFFARFGRTAQYLVLLLASWFFYAWWDVRALPLLLCSIAGTSLIGHPIACWLP